MNAVRVASACLIVALALPNAVWAAPDAQVGPPVGDVEAERLGTVAVLGLDAENLEVGTRMTGALRRAVEASGLTLGGTATLSEVRLIGGCADNSEECLVSGALGVSGDQLLYGALVSRDDGSALLELSLLDVGQARVIASARLPLDQRALDADTVDETAAEALSMVIAMPGPEPEPEPEPIAPVANPPDEPKGDKGKLIWGAYAPRPKWKKALLGASIGVTVLGAVGAAVMLARVPTLEEEVRAAAEASQGTEAEVDVDHGSVQICAQALSEPDPVGQPGDVYNSAVGDPCRRGRRLVRFGTGMIVVGSLGLVGTAVSTTLLFVRRGPPKNARVAPEISPSYAGLNLRARF